MVQVSSSLAPLTQVLDGEALSVEQALLRAGSTLQLVVLQPKRVPYGGAKAYFTVGEELHRGFLANVLVSQHKLVRGRDTVAFVQNRVHHAASTRRSTP